MIKELLSKEEGRTLEFKENTKPLKKIIQTIIAFANTAGGQIVIGVCDKTKEVVGVEDIFLEEERISNAVADTVSPLISPRIQIASYRKKQLLLIVVPHCYGPYYLTAKGELGGTFIRVGSTNRVADLDNLEGIRRSKERKSFDELPNFQATLEDLDMDLARRLFLNEKKKFTKEAARSLFGKKPSEFFKTSKISLVSYLDPEGIDPLDSQVLEVPLVEAIDPMISFVRRNTAMYAKIGAIKREETSQYPKEVLREAVVNALLHADYSVDKQIQVTVYSNRIEVLNPGPMPYGLDLETAISGVSQIRNWVIAKVFKDLRFTDRWGSGLRRMIVQSKRLGFPAPKFEEPNLFFRVTIYDKNYIEKALGIDNKLYTHLSEHGNISVKEAQELWDVSLRTARQRLKVLVNQKKLIEIATSPQDPYKIYVLTKKESLFGL